MGLFMKYFGNESGYILSTLWDLVFVRFKLEDIQATYAYSITAIAKHPIESLFVNL